MWIGRGLAVARLRLCRHGYVDMILVSVVTAVMLRSSAVARSACLLLELGAVQQLFGHWSRRPKSCVGMEHSHIAEGFVWRIMGVLKHWIVLPMQEVLVAVWPTLAFHNLLPPTKRCLGFSFS